MFGQFLARQNRVQRSVKFATYTENGDHVKRFKNFQKVKFRKYIEEIIQRETVLCRLCSVIAKYSALLHPMSSIVASAEMFKLRSFI